MSYLVEVYQRAAGDLAAGMPPEVRAECDRLLGPDAGPHERWVYYVSTTSHLDHGSAPVQVSPAAHRRSPTMNNTPTTAKAQTVANAFQRALERAAFERSDMNRDGNSSYWRSQFEALAGVLRDRMGLDAYRQWFDVKFPDDGTLYTCRDMHSAIDAEIKKGQAQP